MLSEAFGTVGQGAAAGGGLAREVRALAETVETKADTRALQDLVTSDELLFRVASKADAAALEAAAQAIAELQQTVRKLTQRLYGVSELP